MHRSLPGVLPHVPPVLPAGDLSAVTAQLSSTGAAAVSVMVLTCAMVAISAGEEAWVIATLVLLAGDLSVAVVLLARAFVKVLTRAPVATLVFSHAFAVGHRIEL